MADTKVEALFKGDVISLHVFFAGHEIPMAQHGSEWGGSRNVDVAGQVLAELVFKAPPGTKWEFVLKVGGAEKVKDSGQSTSALFSRGYKVTV